MVISFLPFPVRAAHRQATTAAAQQIWIGSKELPDFFPEFLNASMLQALNFKMGIITMLISYSCWRPQ